jgi:hypothetical protein
VDKRQSSRDTTDWVQPQLHRVRRKLGLGGSGLGSIPPESNDDLDQLSSTNAAEVARSANPDWATSVPINRFPHRAGEALIPRLNIDSSDRACFAGHAPRILSAREFGFCEIELAWRPAASLSRIRFCWVAIYRVGFLGAMPLATGGVGGGNGTRVFGAWSKARDFRYETFVAADHREGPYGF